MPTITVKNIPDNLYEQLKQAANQNRRSINGEIIVRLERTLWSLRRDPIEILARARTVREMTLGKPITDEEFSRAKSAGRP